MKHQCSGLTEETQPIGVEVGRYMATKRLGCGSRPVDSGSLESEIEIIPGTIARGRPDNDKLKGLNRGKEIDEAREIWMIICAIELQSRD